MYTTANKLELDSVSLFSTSDHTEMMASIEKEILPKTDVRYTHRIEAYGQEVNPSETVYIVLFHDENKYPHNYFERYFDRGYYDYEAQRRDEKNGRMPTELTVDQVMLYHFCDGAVEAYLFPLHPPKGGFIGEEMAAFSGWKNWNREICVKGSCIEYKLSADFYDALEYTCRAYCKRYSGFTYDFVKKELKYHCP